MKDDPRALGVTPAWPASACSLPGPPLPGSARPSLTLFYFRSEGAHARDPDVTDVFDFAPTPGSARPFQPAASIQSSSREIERATVSIFIQHNRSPLAHSPIRKAMSLHVWSIRSNAADFAAVTERSRLYMVGVLAHCVKIPMEAWLRSASKLITTIVLDS
jgi:hypothetical protein